MKKSRKRPRAAHTYAAVIAMAITVLTALAAPAEPATSETDRLNTWLDSHYELELQLSPVHMTELGRRDRYSEIDDLSEAAELAQYRLLERSVADLRQEFDYDKLTPEGRISYDFWIYRLDRFRDYLPFQRHDFIFSSEGGPHSYLPDFLINMHTVESMQDMLDYITRTGGVARALDQSLARAMQAAGEGIRPPRFAYESVLEVAARLTTGAPFTRDSKLDSPLWVDANNKIDGLLARGVIDQAQAENLRQETATALRDRLLPAYSRLTAWLRKDLPNAPTRALGATSLPDGAAYYDYSLAANTTTRLDAAQINELGMAEVAHIRDGMEAIKRRAGFKGNLHDFLEFVRTDAQFFFSNDDTGRAAYIALSQSYIATMQARLPEYFEHLPKAGLVVKRVEPFMEEDGMAPYYVDGLPDGSRPGTYYLHLSDMRALNRTDLQTNAYHEAVPGHHLQTSIALERQDLPLFRRDIWYSAYGEGWALYAEYLAAEMGAFTDLYNELGYLASQMWRAARLVVDTGLHARGWSEQQAVDYFLANLPITEMAARAEIRRYIVTPGQATSYKIGMLKILELREKARSRLKENFDIRGFHDAVLGGGSLPLPLLERRVTNWIEDRATNARE